MQKIKKILLFIILSFGIFFSNLQVFAAGQGTTGLANGPTTNNTQAVQGGSVGLANGPTINEKMSNPTGDINTESKLGANSSDQIDGADGILMKIVKFARESIFNLLWVIVVGVLLYIGFKLIIGKGTPDIFKKAMMGFVYLIIGVVIIYTAWAMVKIILGVNF